MNLIVDIGNTRTKIALFKDKEIVFSTSEPTIDLKSSFNKLIGEFNAIKHGIISSVVEIEKELFEQINTTCELIFFDEKTPIPIRNKYKTPQTLGKDRLAGAVGAWVNFKQTNVLIIDSGTCLKIDLLNSNHEYLGGIISPGLEMRFKALNQFTNKLPLVNHVNKTKEFIGKTTETSILSGVLNGIKFEILGFINEYLLHYPDLKIITTGGAVNFFDLEPKNRIFARPNLILEGLNEIVLFNAK